MLGQQVWDGLMGENLFENAMHVASAVGKHEFYDFILGNYPNAFTV